MCSMRDWRRPASAFGSLKGKLAELRAKYQALHQKQFKPNRKKNAAWGEKVSDRSRGKKKRGAPVGHPGWFRLKPKEIDRSVHVPAPQRCPHCGSTDLTPIDESMEHLQEDIVVVPRPAVTRYVHEQAFCKHCRKPVVQAAADEILHAPIGPVAKAIAMYLRYDVCIPYRKVVEILRVLFGLSSVPASLVGFDQKAAKMGAGIYQDLREKLRASLIAHADETSWRNDGVGHYVWFGGNENIAYLSYRPSPLCRCGKGHLWRLCRNPGARSLCCLQWHRLRLASLFGAYHNQSQRNQSGACTPSTE